MFSNSVLNSIIHQYLISSDGKLCMRALSVSSANYEIVAEIMYGEASRCNRVEKP